MRNFLGFGIVLISIVFVLLSGAAFAEKGLSNSTKPTTKINATSNTIELQIVVEQLQSVTMDLQNVTRELQNFSKPQNVTKPQNATEQSKNVTKLMNATKQLTNAANQLQNATNPFAKVKGHIPQNESE